jgi:hypothetical protein
MLDIDNKINTAQTQSALGIAIGRAALHAVHVPTTTLNEAALCDWIAQAMVGQSIQYHEGFLLLDRSESTSSYSTKERNRLHSVARRAWIACEMGLVHLFSLKVADSHYRYIALRSVSTLNPPDIRTSLKKALARASTKSAVNH